MSATAPIHVVAAVLCDARGRILLARRSRGRDLAGLWEFPGGKVEPGETPSQALARELDEELGIRMHAATPLIAVPHAYPHKRILLDVYQVAAYDGVPRGRERQALAWAPPQALANYPMPPADRPVLAALAQPAHYAISPEQPLAMPSLLLAVERLLAEGIRRLQLRWPGHAPAARAAAAALRARFGDAIELLLNADVEGARELGCGVHLRAAQLREWTTRPLPADRAVAASCHDAEDLRLAEQLGVDFAVLGPVQATASHPERAPLGWRGFADARAACSLPVYALGGMGGADLRRAREHGAQGIAGIRGLWPPVAAHD